MSGLPEQERNNERKEKTDYDNGTENYKSTGEAKLSTESRGPNDEYEYYHPTDG